MKKTLIILLILGVVVLPYVCLAQGVGVITSKITEIGGYIKTIGFALVTLMVLYAGVLFVVSSGDPSKLSTAKAVLLWALIGGVVILVAATISALVGGT